MAKLELKDFLTLANALSGVVGISLAIAGFGYAWLYIFVAMLFDYLDGRVARASFGANEFGKQLDSLADTVSFVVAPTVVVMKLQPDLWLTVASAFFVCLGLLRLAWFNLQGDRKHFYGLPTPPAALTVLVVNVLNPHLTAVALFLVGVAMVTPIKINKL